VRWRGEEYATLRLARRDLERDDQAAALLAEDPLDGRRCALNDPQSFGPRSAKARLSNGRTPHVRALSAECPGTAAILRSAPSEGPPAHRPGVVLGIDEFPVMRRDVMVLGSTAISGLGRGASFRPPTTRRAVGQDLGREVRWHMHTLMTQVGSHATPDHAATGLGRDDRVKTVEPRYWPLFDVSACEVLCGTDRTASQGQVSE
jgi:hypothetical protein